jgi:erythronate-4-phosphate dehydrogenase
MSTPLHIVADRHIWHAEQAFAHFSGYDVTLQTLEASDIQASSVRSADILLTRSFTQVNSDLLADSTVRFVATATIGEDHIDLPYLKQRGIGFASAAGSSTGSVIEYMLASLLQLQHMKRISLDDCTLGIIGAGRIGGLLDVICRDLGISTLCNDPPRAALEPNAALHHLAYVLEHADILTVHTPLVLTGSHPTKHLINADVLARFRGHGVINAGRGACVDNYALLDWLNDDAQHWAILDCWEREPAIDQALLAHPNVLIATPHIAGHSLDGKAANTQYVYHALCEFLASPPLWQMEGELPAPRPTQHLELNSDDAWAALQQMVSVDYPIMEDHQQMKSWLSQSDTLPQAFRHYRRHYPVRRAWAYCPWLITDEKLKKLSTKLGYLA